MARCKATPMSPTYNHDLSKLSWAPSVSQTSSLTEPSFDHLELLILHESTMQMHTMNPLARLPLCLQCSSSCSLFLSLTLNVIPLWEVVLNSPERMNHSLSLFPGNAVAISLIALTTANLFFTFSYNQLYHLFHSRSSTKMNELNKCVHDFSNRGNCMAPSNGVWPILVYLCLSQGRQS